MNIKSEIQQVELLKALAHPLRLRIVKGLLLKNECSVSEMVGKMAVPQSTVSQQLGILRRQGIVDIRKEGVRVCYRVADPRVVSLIQVLSE